MIIALCALHFRRSPVPVSNLPREVKIELFRVHERVAARLL
jgi:hypothetical protein